MAGLRGMMIKMVMACLMVMAMAKGATAAEYVVGDSLGWTLPPNTSFYSDWAASKTFQIGDTIVFNWNETSDNNWAEVTSKEKYDNCSDPGLVFDHTIKANLISDGSRFIICTVGNHCQQGQKITITVGSPTTTAPSGASSLTATSLGSLFGLVSTLVVISSMWWSPDY